MKSKAGRSAAFAPKQSRLMFSEGKIQVRNARTHARTYTRQESKDRSQVITTLTPCDGDPKCLPPDWPKELSNGSSSKPDHMLLDNKYSTSFFFTPFLCLAEEDMWRSVFIFTQLLKKICKKSHFTPIFNESISSKNRIGTSSKMISMVRKRSFQKISSLCSKMSQTLKWWLCLLCRLLPRAMPVFPRLQYMEQIDESFPACFASQFFCVQ